MALESHCDISTDSDGASFLQSSDMMNRGVVKASVPMHTTTPPVNNATPQTQAVFNTSAHSMSTLTQNKFNADIHSH